MPTTFNLNGLADPVTRNFIVFTKGTWSENWTWQPGFMVEEVAWSEAPNVSTASIQYRSGSVMLPGGDNFYPQLPVNERGYFVLILIATMDSQWLPWLGYADSPVVIEEDAVSQIQRIPCYGFDRVLQYCQIVSTVHVDPDDDTTWKRTDSGGVFNGVVRGNRSEQKIKLASSDPDPTLYAFAEPGDEGQTYWSTQEIAKHLLNFHLPTPSGTAGVIPWSIAGASALPDWDRPRLMTDQRSIHSCLTELVNQEMALGWRVVPRITTSGANPATMTVSVTAVEIEFFTRTADDVALPSLGTVPANTAQAVMFLSYDPLTEATIDVDDSDVVDQLIFRGPKEIAVGTFKYATEWGEGWTLAQAGDYADGWSAEPFWPSRLAKQRELNVTFRSLPEYEDVYRVYPILDAWDGTCDGDPLFYKPEVEEGEPEPDTYVPYLGNVRILQDLPLYVGVDYTGAADEIDESAGRKRHPIIVHIEDPRDPGLYIALQNALIQFGAMPARGPNALTFGVSVNPYFERGPGFTIDIQGAPQHAMETGFTGNEADPERTNVGIWGNLDRTKIQITAAMQGDRRPEVRIPNTVTADLVRRRYITMEHPALEHVHLAAATVVGVDGEGDLRYSDGGTLRDPFALLAGLATLASRHVLTPRHRVMITTGRVLAIQPGTIITHVDGQDVESVVREVRITSPVVNDESPPPLTMTIEASENEFDIAGVVARIPTPENVG